jgi:hypothetical protein
MLSIQAKIARAERVVRMLEEDAPLLALRIAPLPPEQQKSVKSYADRLRAHAREELETLVLQGSFLDFDGSPQAAD